MHDVDNVNMISVDEPTYVARIMDMHDRLKKARSDAGFKSARAAAARLGLSTSTYAAHENGQNDYDHSQAADYAKAFKVSAGWLLYGEGDPTPSHAIEASGENNTLANAEDENLFREAYRRARDIETELIGGRGPRLEFAKMVSIIYEELLSEKAD